MPVMAPFTALRVTPPHQYQAYPSAPYTYILS
jgi:hypothetical protein